MTMCGGVNPTDDCSEMKGKGEALAACFLCEVISWCPGERGECGAGILVALEQFFDRGIGGHAVCSKI